MRESDYQKHVISEIEKKFDGCIILKNDCNYVQGIPDLTIFHNDKWATLEVKVDEKSDHQPNQDYYISKMNNMSFAKFIYPQNEKEVLDELEQAFKPRRKTRVSRSK